MARRILYVENGLGFGGATRCLYALLAGAIERGHEPFVAIAYDDPQVNALVDKLHRVDLSAFRRIGAKSTPGRPRAGFWSRTGGRLTGSATWWINSIVRDRPLREYVQHLIRAWGIDLVHTNNGLLANRAEIQAAARADVPLIAHQRGWEWPCALSRSLVRLPARIIAVSDAVRRDLMKLHPPADRVTRIYDGIDVRHFAPRSGQHSAARGTYGIPPDHVVVGLIAARLAWKGHDLFLRAMSRICRRFEHVTGLIVGSRPQKAEKMTPAPQAVAEQLGLKDRLVWLEHAEDPADIYAACDVLAHASVHPEPLGLVILEAMAAGIPVVAARDGGPQETVLHGRTGVLYPTGDATGLASAIAALVGDPALRHRLGAAARQRAVECFDVRRSRRMVFDLYPEILAGHVRPQAAETPCPFEPSCS